MALEKELINGKGVKTAYHRIDSISMVNGIKVTVKSYTDESYRQQEKDRDALIKRDEEVKKQLEEEMAKTGDEYDKEKVIALTEESNEIGFPEPLDLAIFIHTFEYPGTWAAWGGGRTPVGVNPADTDFKTVEKTGGEKTHTLTVDEITPHSHIETVYWNAGGSGTAHPAAVEAGDPRKYGGLVARTENTGGGQAHNNLQPYITCYIWKRTT